jgi:hypothetical protein
MKRNTQPITQLAGLMFAWQIAALAVHGAEKPPVPDFTQGDMRGESQDWTLGPTGARGWIYAWKGQTAEARQILVTDVAPGSPAEGLLRSGDVVLGVADQRFSDDARLQFARAITAAEEERGRGSLRLMRWRAGETQTVDLKLKVMGTFSNTAPFDCPKSARIFELGCQAIAKKGLRGVSIPNDLNALALLASGKGEYRPMLAEYAKEVARFRADSFATWYYGYANMFLAEYYMATGDQSVFEGVKRLAMESAHGQSAVGTWGHKFARPDGNLNGYGCMNQPGLSLTISMVLAREAGVNDPELDRAISKATSFLRWFVNKGAIPYGDHEPWPGHEDNGKCSSAAVLFDLLGDRETAEFYARMSGAAYSERERGHTGHYFNVLWELLGVARCGPVALGAYFKERAWYFDLARSWDGSVAYQGSPVGEEEHGKYTDWDCTGSYLLGYAMSQKSLYLTGKRAFCVPPLSHAQADEVIAAGRDFFPVGVENGYDRRTNEQLLVGLSSWSPAVRKRSAEAIGRRNADVISALLGMLAGTHRESRYGACEALGRLGPDADKAAPQLRALLGDSDPWLQSLAARALPSLGPEVRLASVSDLLAMAVRQNPADPRRMAQRAACIALFAPYPGSRGTRSILADSLDGVDRDLLYPAIKSVLQNDDSVARGSLSRIYDKLTDEDVVAVLPAIVRAVEELAPSNEMFGDSIRLAGLDLVTRLHLREGMGLCVAVIEPDRWGTRKRMPQCLEYVVRYGVHAKAVVPQLEELRRTVLQIKEGKEQAEQVKMLDDCIAKIAASSDSPTILDLQDFTRRSNQEKTPAQR